MTEEDNRSDHGRRPVNMKFLDDFEYERIEEEKDLWLTYRETVKNVSPSRQLVLLTGSPGSGKTILASRFGRLVSNDGGFFISGKSDPLQRRAYAPFVSAMAEFVSLVEQQGPDYARSVKSRILERIAVQTALMTSMVPALTKILGGSEEPVSSSANVTSKEVGLVFVKLLTAIASAGRPVVLFLDNLQWVDQDSLDLLQVIVSHRRLESFMLLAACRGDEVALNDPLAVLLRNAEDCGVSIRNIRVEKLDCVAIGDVVSHLYQLPEVESAKITHLLLRETGGALFLLFECLRSLHEDGMLSRDSDTGKWLYKDMNIDMCIGDISAFVDFKFKQLPQKCRDALLLLSCVGSGIEKRIAKVILSSDVYKSLGYGEEKGLIQFDADHSWIFFAHDFVQQSIYRTMNQSRQAELHNLIGRCLLTKLPGEQLESTLFLVADQLKLGSGLVGDREEKSRHALIFLRAGQRAASTTGFSIALDYLETGMALLNGDHWKTSYQLSLAIFNATAEACLVNAKLERADELIEEILDEAWSLEDKLQAYTTKLFSLGAQGNMIRAFETGLVVLRLQGVRMPVKPSVIQSTLEVARTRILLTRTTDDNIVRLPLLKNMKLIPILRMMNLVLLYAYLANSEFTAIVAMRIVQLTMKNGLSEMCPFSFAIYGTILACVLGRPQEGYHYGQLSLRLQDRFKSKSWLPRVYACVYSIVNPWSRCLEESVEPLRFAHHAALESGDIEVAMINGHTAILLMFSAGLPLVQLVPGMQRMRDLAVSYKQSGVLQLIELKLQEVLNLLGRSDNVFILSGEVMDQRVALEQAHRGRHSLVNYGISAWQCEIACFLLDYELATKHAAYARHVCKTRFDDLWTYTTSFYEAISALALARESAPTRSKLVKRGYRNLKFMRRRGRLCPSNFAHMIALVEAELTWLGGRKVKAIMKYDESIEMARRGRFLHHQALACERKALSLRSSGDKIGWFSSIELARALYGEWGAVVKRDQIENMVRTSRWVG